MGPFVERQHEGRKAKMCCPAWRPTLLFHLGSSARIRGYIYICTHPEFSTRIVVFGNPQLTVQLLPCIRRLGMGKEKNPRLPWKIARLFLRFFRSLSFQVHTGLMGAEPRLQPAFFLIGISEAVVVELLLYGMRGAVRGKKK